MSNPASLPPDLPSDLMEAARAIRARAYAPYSGFFVGAALRGEDGRIHVAANVENAAYPQSQCAEASAVGVMIAAGGRRITEVAVVGSGGEPVTPCGGCRQRLNEFAAKSTRLHCFGADGGPVLTVTLGELLPHSFGPTNLGVDQPA